MHTIASKGNIMLTPMSTEAVCPCCTLHYVPGSTLNHCDNIGLVVWWLMATI